MHSEGRAEQSGSMCPLCRRALDEGDLCVGPESLTGRTAARRNRTIRSRLDGLLLDRGKTRLPNWGSLREERRLACKGRRGRTAAPIFRSGLSPPPRRGGVRVPWERSEQQEGRWIWRGCVRKPRWYPGLDTSWPSFTRKLWPPH